jgi:large subunit ribosomal protein L7/L12
LIKEVRAVFNLGLKEAKDVVEKTPVILKKDTPRMEAEEIQKRLEENGGKVDLE